MQDVKTTEKKQGVVIKVVENAIESVTKKEVHLSKSKSAVISKCVHVLEFSLFSVFLTLSLFFLQKNRKSAYQSVLLCGTFLGITDEHFQLLYEGRGSKLTDVIVDIAGVMIGYMIAKLILKLIWRKKDERDRSVL
jgi:VanZ family protein